jgi:acyl carrier protein
MEDLIYTLKEQIIETLNLEEMTPEDIKDDVPLFGGGYGLDSIDVLELIVLLEKNYGIELESPAEAKDIFVSVRTIAEYVTKNRKK